MAINMDCFGDQFFTGTGLTMNQNSRFCWRHFIDVLIELHHGLAVTNHATQIGISTLGTAGTLLFSGALQGMIGDNSGYCIQHFIMIKGFGNIIHSTAFHRIDRRAQAGIAGHNQYRHITSQLD